MKNFYIITNQYKDKNLALTKNIAAHIEAKGGICSNFVTQKTDLGTKEWNTLKFLDTGAECVIVLGGDGTLVRAARSLARYDVPLIGVNLGNLGYLCELEPNNVYWAIDRLFKDEYQVEERMMLRASLPGEVCALNDIVIHRGETSQVVQIRLVVNGEYLTTFDGDGIIVSTPTGATGYNLSAGGPIVDPKEDLIVITPLNPHDVHSSSIVLGADSQIEVLLSERRPERDEAAVINCDGDLDGFMHVGDSIRIWKDQKHARILRLNDLSFLQILRKKMARET